MRSEIVENGRIKFWNYSTKCLEFITSVLLPVKQIDTSTYFKVSEYLVNGYGKAISTHAQPNKVMI